MNIALGLLGLPVVLALFLLGTITLLNNSKNYASRTFMGICYSFGFWIMANYFADSFQGESLFWSRLAFVAVTVAAYCFVVFVHNFPMSQRKPIAWYRVIGLTALAALIAVECTGYFIPNVVIDQSKSNIEAGSLYILFPVYLVGVIVYSLAVLFGKLVKARGETRARIGYVLFGVLLTAIAGGIPDLLLPSITGNNNYATVGTFSTVIFAAVTTYAIIRHHLFDIRPYAARALAYALTLMSIFLLFLGFVSILSQTALGDSTHISSDLGPRLLFISLTLISALIFQPIKRFFDHFSNRLFYRDAYNPQTLLDQLNEILVGTIDSSTILHDSADLLAKTLNASLVGFVVADKSTPKPRIITNSKNASDPAFETLAESLQKSAHDVISREELERRGGHLLETFESCDIALTVRLATHHQHIGHILVGHRRSGSPYTSQDIQLLTIIADEIAIALQNALSFEEIRNFNQTLQQKVVEATNNLRRTNEKLKALDETKDEFITMASHQLRTPLTSVKGYLSMVLEGDAGKLNSQQQQLLRQSYASAQRMVYLISDLLNLSRLNTGKFVIETTPVDLCEIVQSEIDQLTETAKSREVELQYEGAASVPRLLLDETKIHQVVMNFMDNAVYYTPAGGKITVSLTETPTAIEFRVTDTGIGVPRHVQHRLFTKFYRAENAQRARPDGTGLGLFMAKKVIVAQGGSIIFDSEEGKGSTFGFRFSKSRHLAPVSTK